MIQQGILMMMPVLEAKYHRANAVEGGPPYKLMQDQDPARNNNRGVYMVAARDIQMGEPILFEDPLSIRDGLHHPSLLVESNTKAKEYFHTLSQSQFNQQPEADATTTVCAEDAKVQHAMARLGELNAVAWKTRQSPQIGDIWDLEDSHRCAEIGDLVTVDGLSSKAGYALNGKTGTVLNYDENTPGRLGVKIQTARNTTTVKSIKATNLKTLGGIWITNAFGGGGSKENQCLYKLMSRINHACLSAANSSRIINDKGKACVLARTDIPVGKELFIDYMPREKGDRVGLLQMKYNFTCQCSGH